jgi:hypothetical protein
MYAQIVAIAAALRYTNYHRPPTIVEATGRVLYP